MGDMQNVIDPVADASASVNSDEDDPGLAEAMRVEIRGQRDETPAEIAERRLPGIAFWIDAVGAGLVGFAVTAGRRRPGLGWRGRGAGGPGAVADVAQARPRRAREGEPRQG